MPCVVSGERLVHLASFAAALSVAVVVTPAGEAGILDEAFRAHANPPRFYQPPLRSSGRQQAVGPGSNMAFAPGVRFGRFVHVWQAVGRDAAAAGTAAGSRPVAPAFCVRRGRAPGTASRLRQILDDRTLRAGDIVVTDVGVRVFRGARACPHIWREFVTPGTADLSAGAKAYLAKLEIAMRADRGDARR